MPKKGSLPTLTTIQSGIEELQITLKSLVGQSNLNFKSVDDRFDEQEKFNQYIKREFRAIDKRFDDQEDKFKEWKSELFTKIDKSYAKPIKDLQEDDAAQQFRLDEHEKRISKLEKPTFASA